MTKACVYLCGQCRRHRWFRWSICDFTDACLSVWAYCIRDISGNEQLADGRGVHDNASIFNYVSRQTAAGHGQVFCSICAMPRRPRPVPSDREASGKGRGTTNCQTYIITVLFLVLDRHETCCNQRRPAVYNAAVYLGLYVPFFDDVEIASHTV